jgi:DNA-directed RNA polymerase subunit RPC12/RpoP
VRPCRRATPSASTTCASYHLVRASCHACGHKAIVPNAALLQGRPGYTRLMSLERQLRCRSCGARGRASLEVEFRPRD